MVFAQGGLTFYPPTVVTQADYMINVAGLKGHTMAGMTVCAKNHQGTVLKADGSYGARDVHPSIAVRSFGNRWGAPAAQAMGSYNGLVDMNGHPEVGGKTMLYIIDGLYATQHNEFRLTPVCKVVECALQRQLDLQPLCLAGRRGHRLGCAGLPPAASRRSRPSSPARWTTTCTRWR